MFEVENYHEPVTYEQLFHSHVYEIQLELLQKYFIRPTSNIIPIVLEVNQMNIIIKPEKEQVPS